MEELLTPAERALLEQVDPVRLRETVDRLSAFPTRYAWSTHNLEAAHWLDEVFSRSYPGHSRVVTYERFGRQSQNVVCAPPSPAGDAIVLCAHFDSIAFRSEFDPDARAPGANDNASGVAALLEIARILAGASPACRVRFLCVSGEELGYHGSHVYAKAAAANGDAIRLVINLDMVGAPTDPGRARVVVEHDAGGLHSDNDARSRRYADLMEIAARRYAGLAPERRPMHHSDHVSFEVEGFVAIGAYDGSFPSKIPHTEKDTPDRLDYDYLARVTRMTLATVLLASRSVEPQLTLNPESSSMSTKTPTAPTTAAEAWPPNFAAWQRIFAALFSEPTLGRLREIRGLAAEWRAFGQAATREKLVAALTEVNGGTDPWDGLSGEQQAEQLDALGAACLDHHTNRSLAPWDTANDVGPDADKGELGALKIW